MTEILLMRKESNTNQWNCTKLYKGVIRGKGKAVLEDSRKKKPLLAQSMNIAGDNIELQKIAWKGCLR
jgi:hypothetical protein